MTVKVAKTFPNHRERRITMEDMLLPDDFQAEPQVEETSQEALETVEEVEDTNQTETTEEAIETPSEPLKFKVKYNKEEQELTYDDAVPLIQKGMNYDKLQERLQQFESDPKLALIQELAADQGLTPDEYVQQVREWREQEKLNQLIQSNIPEDLAKEVLETRKLRDEIKQEKEQKAKQEQEGKEFQEFFQTYKENTGKDFDPQKDQLPPEVWEIQAQGVPLKFAYLQHHTKELQNQLKILKQNEENAKRAPVGSVSTHGTTKTESDDPFLRGFDSI